MDDSLTIFRLSAVTPDTSVVCPLTDDLCFTETCFLVQVPTGLTVTSLQM
ncbi:hypothetical protein A0J48_003850 [Sphaerospermopsis aphanizomenoides BCCUSP55]|nr:hypothetical protein [Sphaerospermopsis aphanizomenoides]MBK1986681.1 hypothetical protein [Sphaerospermopsis aphanizomenoides BCCUSP55]